MFSFKSVLVPTDFSEGFELALNYAIEIAHSMESVIHILHVVEPAVYPADLGYSQVSFIDVEKELEKNAETEISSISRRLEKENITFVTKIAYGRPSDQIIDYAESNDIELICIATHGRSGFEHLLFGSTTEKVLRRASCPVLAVRMNN